MKSAALSLYGVEHEIATRDVGKNAVPVELSDGNPTYSDSP